MTGLDPVKVATEAAEAAAREAHRAERAAVSAEQSARAARIAADAAAGHELLAAGAASAVVESQKGTDAGQDDD